MTFGGESNFYIFFLNIWLNNFNIWFIYFLFIFVMMISKCLLQKALHHSQVSFSYLFVYFFILFLGNFLLVKKVILDWLLLWHILVSLSCLFWLTKLETRNFNFGGLGFSISCCSLSNPPVILASRSSPPMQRINGPVEICEVLCTYGWWIR